MAKKSDIGNIASEKTKKEFAEKISNLTILTAKEVEKLFPIKDDRVELEELIKIINLSIDDIAKKKKLVQNMDKVGGALIKIAKKILSV